MKPVVEDDAEVQQHDATVASPEAAVPLEQLLEDVQRLYAQATTQVKGLGELAFMEFELALGAIKWGLWALLMFSAACLFTGTFLLLAAAFLLLEHGVSAPVVLALCGLVNALVAFVLYLLLKNLSQKIRFANLRRHLAGVADNESAH
jgi:hypothetical protein